MNLELQQRASEYTHLLKMDELKFGLLERMPAIAHNALNAAAATFAEGEPMDEEARPSAGNPEQDLLFSTEPSTNPASGPIASSGGDLFDLIGLNNGNNSSNAQATQPTTGNDLFDLQDLIGGVQKTTSPKVSTAPRADASFAGLFDSLSTELDGEKAKPSMIAVNKSGLEMQLIVDSSFSDSSSGKEAILRLITTNNNPIPIEQYNFKAAVTKAYQIELLPASSARLEANAMSTVIQIAKVKRNTTGQQLRIRLQLNYEMNGAPHTIQQEVSSIPGMD